MEQITQGMSGEEAANIIYNNDIENETGISAINTALGTTYNEIGASDLDGANSNNTAGTLYINAGAVSPVKGTLQQLKIRINPSSSAGTVGVAILSNQGDNYRVDQITDVQVATGENTLTDLNIPINAGDAIGIVVRNAATGIGRLQAAGAGSFSTIPSAIVGSTLPTENIISQGAVADNRINYNFSVVGGEFIDQTNQRLAAVEAQTAFIPSMREDISEMGEFLGNGNLDYSLGITGTPTSWTSNQSAAYLPANLNSIFTAPSKVNSLYFEIDIAADVYIIILENVSAGTWRESTRVLISAEAGENTIDVSELNISGNTGATIALYSPNARFRYMNNATGYMFFGVFETDGLFEFVNPAYPDKFPQPNNIAVIFTAQLSSLTVTERLQLLEGDVESADPVFADYRGTQLYGTNFQSLPNEWVNSGWSLVEGGVSPSSNGLASTLRLNKQYSVDRRGVRVTARLGADSRFILRTVNKETNATQCSMAEVDVAAGEMRIYTASAGGNSALPSVSSTSPLAIVAGRDYIIDFYIDKNQFLNRLTVIDTVSAQRFTLEDTSKTAGRHHDCYAICNYSGAAPLVKNCAVYTPCKRGMFGIILGDSIDEAMGNGVETVDGWAQRTVSAWEGNGAVSGRGSGNINGVIERISTEVAVLRPRHVVIKIGTNAGNTLALLRSMVSLAQSYGAIVTLNNIPMRNADISARNADIATVRSEFGIKGALFDVATAVNFDPAQGQDTSKFYSDLVHPLLFGQTFMFDRLAIDTPYLLY